MAAVAYGVEEEEVWKCGKHPSKRRRNGICATCLRERLGILCPHCAQVRPCPCVYSSTSSSSSASASSSSSIGRVLDGGSTLRRSRSVAIPFLRSSKNYDDPNNRRFKTPSFLSVFKRSKTKRSEQAKENFNDLNGDGDEDNSISNHRIEDFARMITRSRSVNSAAATASNLRRGDATSAASKAKFWRFPMKIFRS
ncbi:uncharacterized protein LOC127240473 [Andrographis paniculata]|uniref:uncharacterized protein LOC127240473 n=1 Tax=Andrographis paniculata TaxID=175694 RepID=UPI0021E8058E|nr:uncharacterized protein LOC127240473 [Andrographis paniculata]